MAARGNVASAGTLHRTAITLITLGILWPRTARADAGLPMLVLMWPSSWILFIPICLIEAWVARRLLALPFNRCLKMSLVANAWSTLIGIPLIWLALFLIELLLVLVLPRFVDLEIVSRALPPLF